MFGLLPAQLCMRARSYMLSNLPSHLHVYLQLDMEHFLLTLGCEARLVASRHDYDAPLTWGASIGRTDARTCKLAMVLAAGTR